jgi:hypothetical protein
MVRYRVTYKAKESLFGYEYNDIQILESDSYICRYEIAKRLNINVDEITNVEILQCG